MPSVLCLMRRYLKAHLAETFPMPHSASAPGPSAFAVGTLRKKKLLKIGAGAAVGCGRLPHAADRVVPHDLAGPSAMTIEAITI